MAGLLVSVRSAPEARAALAGGARVIDVKDPARGPLGDAGPPAWAEVRAAVPAEVPVSVALGELAERLDGPPPPAGSFAGVALRKLGLAGMGGRPDWPRLWAGLRDRWGAGPPWIAVAYADWRRADAPDPDAVLDAALAAPDCVGVLVDTWDKSAAFDPAPAPGWVARARAGRRVVALAGRLDAAGFARMGRLAPDLFAVRGAACVGGDRLGPVDPARVAVLARAAAAVGPRPRRAVAPSSIQSAACPPACPACGGRLVEVKAKLQCARCRAICETCCEGGPG